MTDNNESIKTELKNIATRFVAYQKNFEQFTSLPFSTAALIRRFPALGSDKTFGLILEGKYEGNLGRQLENYRRALAQLEKGMSAANDVKWPDMKKTERVLLAVTEAREQSGVNRYVKVVGRSGFGKSSCVAVLEDQFPNEVVPLEMDVTTSLGVLLRKILERLNEGRRRAEGEKKRECRIPETLNARLEAVIAGVNDSHRLILALDEAHHLRADSLNALKTLLNQCPLLVVVVLGVHTLMKAMEDDAPEEAAQLNDNRLYESITLEVSAEDVERFVTRRLDGKIHRDLIREQSERIAARANARKGFALLRDFSYWLGQAAGGGQITPKILEEAVKKL